MSGLSSILKLECTICGKVAVEKSRFTVGTTTIVSLHCGHKFTQVSFKSNDEKKYESIVFTDGAKPRPYQIDAIKFAETAGFRCIIADEQGVGKTIEFLSILRLHREEILPLAAVVPTTVKVQWLLETIRIAETPDKPKLRIQIINTSGEKALPGMDIYIMTYDILKKEDIFSLVDDLKTLMLDECQKIKNHLSERAKAVQKYAQKVEYIIPMSGTPIKNHVGEYFTILNLVAPHRFPTYQGYLDTYCDAYDTGYGTKVGGLKDPERFHEDTKDLILRRTKAEVLSDLPEKERRFYHVELDPKLNKAYAAALKELEESMYEEDGMAKSTAQIAIMSRMRKITGISKVEQCVDFVTEFILSTDRKIVVFTHHIDAQALLQMRLDSYLKDGGMEKCLVLHSGLDGDKRAELTKKFKDDVNARVMIASTLAAGEGLNLQFCSDSVMLERQWNPANEEQAEDRFHRFGQKNAVTITYMIASGTIDEYFTEIVERKRAIIAAAMDGKEVQWESASLMRELADTLVRGGKKKWVL